MGNGISVTSLPDGKICDFIDQKIRNDTPEEYVRQNIERRLVLELEYAPGQIEVEFSIMVGSSKCRVDLVVFKEGQPHTQENAWILIECKKDAIQPSAKRDGLDQLKSYMSACPRAEWGLWTNGRFKSVFRRTQESGEIVWGEANDIPRTECLGQSGEAHQGPRFLASLVPSRRSSAERMIRD